MKRTRDRENLRYVRSYRVDATRLKIALCLSRFSRSSVSEQGQSSRISGGCPDDFLDTMTRSLYIRGILCTGTFLTLFAALHESSCVLTQCASR